MLRYLELKLFEKAGKIKDLKLQPRFLIIPKSNGERATYYVADFMYTETKYFDKIVEDVKGVRTDVYKLKRKLFLLQYGSLFEFREIDARGD